MKVKTPFRYKKRLSMRYADHNTDVRRFVMRDRRYDRLLGNKGNPPPEGCMHFIPHHPGGWRGQELLVDIFQTRMRKLGRCMRGNLG